MRNKPILGVLVALLVLIGTTETVQAATSINTGAQFKSSIYEQYPGTPCTFGGNAITSGSYWLAFSAYYAQCKAGSDKTVCINLYREKTYLGAKVPDVMVDYSCTQHPFGFTQEQTKIEYYFGCSLTKTYGIRVTFIPSYGLNQKSAPYHGGLACHSN